MNKIREWLRGRKTYICAAIGLASAVLAWADGQISGTALLASVWAAAQSCFLRAGVATESRKSEP